MVRANYRDRNEGKIKSWRGAGKKVHRSWREKEYPLHKENYRQVILTGGDKGEISSFNQKWSRRSREAARTCLLKAPKGKRGHRPRGLHKNSTRKRSQAGMQRRSPAQDRQRDDYKQPLKAGHSLRFLGKEKSHFIPKARKES